jgi:hypothetical protein
VVRPRARTQFMATLPFRNAGVSPALFGPCSRSLFSGVLA